MVVYFSGTGNSRCCAKLLAARLEDELLDAWSFIRQGVAAELICGKPWVFVAPTYAWRLPRIFEAFLRAGRFSGSREAWFVMTCGDGIGAAGEKLAPLCAAMGLHYNGVLPVVMPENYVAMFPVPDRAESARIVAAARPVLEQGADRIRRGEPFEAAAPGLAARAATHLVNGLFYTFAVRTKPFYATEACTGCGLCARRCPLNNVRLSGGKPVWGKDCTHCMVCICGCPAAAIEYGRASRGKPRYQCPEYEA